MNDNMSNNRVEDSVARVISRFKDWKTCVEESFQHSGDFRALCEDYAVCERALENWQASNATMAVQRCQEYTELLEELGKEIHEWLEHRHRLDHSGAGDRPGRAHH